MPVPVTFKSVGRKVEDRNRQKIIDDLAVASVPLGPMTPVRLGDGNDGIFKMHHDMGSQIKDNLRNLLMTNWGDRVIQYELGANLQQLALELSTPPDFENEARLRVERALQRYMPFIIMTNFVAEILFEEIDNVVGHSRIRLTYDVPRLGLQNQQIIIEFYLGG